MFYDYGLPLDAVRWLVNVFRGVEPRPFSFEMDIP